jgi:hypothetical protein
MLDEELERPLFARDELTRDLLDLVETIRIVRNGTARGCTVQDKSLLLLTGSSCVDAARRRCGATRGPLEIGD